MSEQKNQVALRSAIKYQDAASYLLMNSCPSMARSLQQEINEAAIRHKIDMPTSRKHQVCCRCGNIATGPGSTSIGGMGKGSIQQRSKRKKVGAKDKTNEAKPVITRCVTCEMHTKSWMEEKPAIRLNTRTVRHDTQLAISLETGTKRVSRSKTQSLRKKENSLQAMLANSRKTVTANTSSFGLSLMDLMKSGGG